MHEFQGANHPIDDFDALITGGCGNGFRRRMMSRGVRVIETSEPDPEKAAKAVFSDTPLPEAKPHSRSSAEAKVQLRIQKTGVRGFQDA